eukprot:11608998-Ditylum_brightwellii.AAC.1
MERNAEDSYDESGDVIMEFADIGLQGNNTGENDADNIVESDNSISDVNDNRYMIPWSYLLGLPMMV